MRVAAAQASSVWLDKDATTTKVLALLTEAAAGDVELLAFPETFLSGYPFWVERTDGARFNSEQQKASYAAYLEAAVEIDGSQLRAITEAVRDLGIFTYLGVTERGSGPARGTVYCTLVAIDPARGIVGTHRKLMPTYEERLVWGAGDGHGLRVHPVGDARVGGLNCWENWMPQARHALYAGGEDLHVSVWPGSPRHTRDLARFIALEGRVFSLAACGLLRLDAVPGDFPMRELLGEAAEHDYYDGGSAIAGPAGDWLVEPVVGEERLVVANLDLAAVRRERQNFDPTGHYSRPDVFEVRVNRRRLSAAVFQD